MRGRRRPGENKYMARHYSTTNFFRQMPNALLARYFVGKGLLADLDFAGMSETKPHRLLAAWLALPNEQRNTMDADFRDIHDLCDEGGFMQSETRRSGGIGLTLPRWSPGARRPRG